MHYSIQNNTSGRKKGNWKNSWAVLIFLCIILGFSSNAAWKVYQSKIQSAAAANSKEEELEKLEERQTFLLEELEKVETAEGRESLLREKFGLARPGEQVAIIVESEEGAAAGGGENKIWSQIKSIFSKLFER